MRGISKPDAEAAAAPPPSGPDSAPQVGSHALPTSGAGRADGDAAGEAPAPDSLFAASEGGAWSEMARRALSALPLSALPLLRQTSPLLGLSADEAFNQDVTAEHVGDIVSALSGDETRRLSAAIAAARRLAGVPEPQRDPGDSQEARGEAAAAGPSQDGGGVGAPSRAESMRDPGPGRQGVPAGSVVGASDAAAAGAEAAGAEAAKPHPASPRQAQKRRSVDAGSPPSAEASAAGAAGGTDGGSLAGSEGPRSLRDGEFRSAVSRAASSAAEALEAVAVSDAIRAAGGQPPSGWEQPPPRGQALPHSVFEPLDPDVAGWVYGPAALAFVDGARRDNEARGLAAARAAAQAEKAERAAAAAERERLQLAGRQRFGDQGFDALPAWAPRSTPAGSTLLQPGWGAGRVGGPGSGSHSQRLAQAASPAPSHVPDLWASDSPQPAHQLTAEAGRYGASPADPDPLARAMASIAAASRSDEALASIFANHVDLLRRAEASLSFRGAP